MSPLESKINGEFIEEINDDQRTNGLAGVSAYPNALICVDDIVVKPI